jgi:hypothetical protein
MFDWGSVFFTVLGAVLGFGLAIGYDKYQRAQDEKEGYEKIILLIGEEVRTNFEILELLKTGMANDLELMKKGQTVSNPFPYPTQLFFDIVFHYRNQRFLTSDFFMPTINLYRSFLVIRETVTSRETYRNGNRAMENYLEVLQTYDEIVLGHVEKVMPACRTLINHLDPEVRRIAGKAKAS